MISYLLYIPKKYNWIKLAGLKKNSTIIFTIYYLPNIMLSWTTVILIYYSFLLITRKQTKDLNTKTTVVKKFFIPGRAFLRISIPTPLWKCPTFKPATAQANPILLLALTSQAIRANIGYLSGHYTQIGLIKKATVTPAICCHLTK